MKNKPFAATYMAKTIGLLIFLFGGAAMVYNIFHQKQFYTIISFGVIVFGLVLDLYFLEKRSKLEGFNPWDEI